MTERSAQGPSEDGMGPMEEACFQIIASVGTAKSLFIEAISLAKAGKFDEARTRIDEGDRVFAEGHDVHLGLLQQDAAGVGSTNVSLLLVHSEDQLMQAESFRILANEFIDLYERISA
jgi:PTS system cellobiose-specific IIA component